VDLLHNLQAHTRLSLLSDQWDQYLGVSNSSLDTLTAAAVAVIGTCPGSPVNKAQSISTVNQLHPLIAQGSHLSAPAVVSDGSGTPTDSSLEASINNGPQSIVGGPDARTFIEGEAPETGNPLHFWEGNITGTVSDEQLPLVRKSGTIDGIGSASQKGVMYPFTGNPEVNGLGDNHMGLGPLEVGDIQWEPVGGGPLDANNIEWESMSGGLTWET